MSEQLNLMPLDEFFALRTKLQQTARERILKRRDRGDDTTFGQCVLEEMVMLVLEENKALRARVRAVEEILTPDSVGVPKE